MSEPFPPLIRVMIVDDHPMMRDGIAAALLAQGGMATCFAYKTA